MPYTVAQEFVTMSTVANVPCFDCGLCVGSDDDCMVCSECLSSYHIGTCSGISERTFRAKSDATKKQWRCPTCRGARAKKVVDHPSVLAIAELTETVKNLKDTIAHIEASVQMLSDKYDGVLTAIKEQDNKLSDMKRKVDSAESSSNTKQILDIKGELNELERHNRRLNLEFHGIRKTEHENLLDKVNAIAASIAMPALTGTDVTAIHRLPSKAERTPGIIVRFSQQSVRDSWLHSRKKLRDTKSEVMIQENLTKQTRTLLREAKQWARENDVRFVWCANGKVLMRRRDGFPAVLVKRKEDFSKLA